MSPPSACRHTCCVCTYSANKKSDRDRHETNRKSHRACNDSCDRFSSLKKPNLQAQTPEASIDVVVNLVVPERPTPSISRKHSIPEEDPDEELVKREMAEDPLPPAPTPKPEMATLQWPREWPTLTKGGTTNHRHLSSLSLKKSGPILRLRSVPGHPHPPREAMTKPSATSHPRTSVPTRLIRPVELAKSSPSLLTGPSPSQGSATPGKTSVPSPKDPSPSQVAGPEPNRNKTTVESGSHPEDSPAKSPPGESTQNSFDKSDIESLYASPSPEDGHGIGTYRTRFGPGL